MPAGHGSSLVLSTVGWNPALAVEQKAEPLLPENSPVPLQGLQSARDGAPTSEYVDAGQCRQVAPLTYVPDPQLWHAL